MPATVKAGDDGVAKAFAEYANCSGMEEAIRVFVGRLAGKIEKISLLPLKEGVSEVVEISFPDSSACRFTKYITGESSNIKLTRCK